MKFSASSLLSSVKKDGARYPFIDSMRGLCIIGMILYHTLIDYIGFFGSEGVEGLLTAANVIRDIGCSAFFFISGACLVLSGGSYKRPIILFGAGLFATGITALIFPECYIIFGILTAMGIFGIAGRVLKKPFLRLPPHLFLFFFLVLFFVFFRCIYGACSFFGKTLFEFPRQWYSNYVSAFFGFPFDGFCSLDYYPVLPWIFIYFAGFFFMRTHEKIPRFRRLLSVEIRPLSLAGRQSFAVYALHQPVIMGAVLLMYFICK